MNVGGGGLSAGVGSTRGWGLYDTYIGNPAARTAETITGAMPKMPNFTQGYESIFAIFLLAILAIFGIKLAKFATKIFK